MVGQTHTDAENGLAEESPEMVGQPDGVEAGAYRNIANRKLLNKDQSTNP